MCLGLVLVPVYHLNWARGPAAGLQQARCRVAPSVMSLDGLADTAIALEESGESSKKQTKLIIGLVSQSFCVFSRGKSYNIYII